MALTLGGIVPTGAQSLVSPPADSTRVLTLQEAVELSYRQNPAMEAQRIAREAAIDRRKSAWGLRMPQLGVTAAYTYMSEDIKAFDLNGEKNAALEQIGQLPLPFPIPPEIVQAVKGLDLSLTLQQRQFAVVGAYPCTQAARSMRRSMRPKSISKRATRRPSGYRPTCSPKSWSVITAFRWPAMCCGCAKR